MRKRLLPFAATILALVAVIYLGRMALDHLRAENTYSVDISQIDCASPAGMSRSEFLDEVQYASGLPSRLYLLDEVLPRRLARAFRRHAWVESVERVEVVPPASIRVQLRFRKPVLAVPLGNEVRAVDKTGVLLPRDATTKNLPVFPGVPAPPKGPAGTLWRDVNVIRAARKAAKK